MNIEYYWAIILVLPFAIISYSYSLFLIPLSIIILSVFQSTAAVSIGDYVSISPVIVYLILVFPRMLYVSKFFPFIVHSSSDEKREIATHYRWLMIPLILFGLYCAIITPIDLYFFSDSVKVVSARSGLGSHDLIYLAPSISNVAQTGYVLLWTYTACFIGYCVCESGEKLMKYCELALQISFVITAAFSFFQLIAPSLYLSILSPELHNNTNMYMGDEQYLETGQQRYASSFAEPSGYGSYLSSLFPLFYWRCYFSSKINIASIANFSFMSLSVLLIFLCTSTTGIVTLIGFLVLSFGYSIIFPSISRRLGFGFILLTLISIGISIYYINYQVYDLLGSGIEAMLSKGNTLSFDERNWTVSYAFELLANSFGFGVGLGSARTTSFLLNILCTGGLIGFILISWYIVNIVRILFKLGQIINRKGLNIDGESGNHDFIYLISLCWMSLNIFFAQAVALPDINVPFKWTYSSLLISYYTIYLLSNSMGKPTNSISRSFIPNSHGTSERGLL